MASIAVAVVIVLHPYLSIIYYPMVYLFFYFALPLTQGDTDLLATVRVNGISAAAIGLGMSLIVWQTASRSLAQKNMIEKQKEELLEINRQLKEAASTDMLTGLSNRMIFTEFTEKELAKISRTGNKSAMILLDLDGIKSINDHYGHPVGDLVLKTVSKTIKEELRASDTLARFGGDEFAVLLPETTADKAIMIAERVRMAISKLLYPSTGEKFTITASFGVAELSGEKNSTFDSIYREADLALYRAKELGKNRVEG
jgi:diguanylate cyclase (GGDEF)-like protein